MLGIRNRHEDRRNHGPSLVRPLARLAFLILLAGFAFTAIGQDPVDLTVTAGEWILNSTFGTLRIEAP